MFYSYLIRKKTSFFMCLMWWSFTAFVLRR